MPASLAFRRFKGAVVAQGQLHGGGNAALPSLVAPPVSRIVHAIQWQHC